jgi:hypothetical protein
VSIEGGGSRSIAPFLQDVRVDDLEEGDGIRLMPILTDESGIATFELKYITPFEVVEAIALEEFLGLRAVDPNPSEALQEARGEAAIEFDRLLKLELKRAPRKTDRARKIRAIQQQFRDFLGEGVIML